jgi:hypothetical protein
LIPQFQCRCARSLSGVKPAGHVLMPFPLLSECCRQSPLAIYAKQRLVNQIQDLPLRLIGWQKRIQCRQFSSGQEQDDIT